MEYLTVVTSETQFHIRMFGRSNEQVTIILQKYLKIRVVRLNEDDENRNPDEVHNEDDGYLKYWNLVEADEPQLGLVLSIDYLNFA